MKLSVFFEKTHSFLGRGGRLSSSPNDLASSSNVRLMNVTKQLSRLLGGGVVAQFSSMEV